MEQPHAVNYPTYIIYLLKKGIFSVRYLVNPQILGPGTGGKI